MQNNSYWRYVSNLAGYFSKAKWDGIQTRYIHKHKSEQTLVRCEKNTWLNSAHSCVYECCLSHFAFEKEPTTYGYTRQVVWRPPPLSPPPLSLSHHVFFTNIYFWKSCWVERIHWTDKNWRAFHLAILIIAIWTDVLKHGWFLLPRTLLL